MNVPVRSVDVRSRYAGLNAPPAPPSVGVSRTVPDKAPSPRVTANGEEAWPTIPDDGPARVYVVTGVATT